MQRPDLTRSTALDTPVPAGRAGAPAAVGAADGLPRAQHVRNERLSRVLDGPGWIWVRPALDAVALITSVILTTRWPGEHQTAGRTWALVAFPPMVMVLLALRGMYERRLRVAILDGIAPVVAAISIAAMAVVVVQVYAAGNPLLPGALAHVWALSVGLVGGGRVAAVGLQRVARARGWTGRRTLVVGAGEVGARVAGRLREHPQYGLRPVGFLDADPLHTDATAKVDLPVLGGAEDLTWIAEQMGVQHVVLAFSSQPDRTLVPLVRRCEEMGLEVSVVPRLFDSVNDRFAYETVGGLPLLRLRHVNPLGWQFAVKHLFDRVAAAALLLVFAPLMAAVALTVRVSSPGPVLFRQRRVGRDGKAFDLLKFRSMAPVALRPPDSTGAHAMGRDEAPGGVEGADRRTRLGRLLRRTSLDELPQLINVLFGQMSLVGPRPERSEFVELFAEHVDRYVDRHRVRSGITGWAQVHGLRGKTSLSDRVEWDNYYIEHWSLGLDVKILALTAVAIFRAAE